MAISKLNFNSLNVTPSASSAIGFDSGADDLETGAGGGSMVFIKKLTASSSGTLSFVNGASDVVLDSTYKEYLFTFNNIHPATNDVALKGNFTTDGTNFNVTKTTTWFGAVQDQDQNYTGLGYSTGRDLAESTSDFTISQSVGNENEACIGGYLHLFNPSSTTFVKHFKSVMSTDWGGVVGATNDFGAGYCNTTSAITGFRVNLSSGNIDAGTITLYGIN
jgi:hypothetical protein